MSRFTEHSFELSIAPIPDPHEPRVACVVVLDCTQAMQKHALGHLTAAWAQFREQLVANSLARKRVEVAVIAFSNDVSQVATFQRADELADLQLPAVEGHAQLGDALSIGLDLLDNRKEVYRNQGIQFYRPWLFVVTHGTASDEARDSEVYLRIASAIGLKSLFVFGVLTADASLPQLESFMEIPAARLGTSFSLSDALRVLCDSMSSTFVAVSITKSPSAPDPAGYQIEM